MLCFKAYYTLLLPCMLIVVTNNLVVSNPRGLDMSVSPFERRYTSHANVFLFVIQISEQYMPGRQTRVFLQVQNRMC